MFQLALDLASPEVLDWPLAHIAEWEGFYAYKNWLASQEKK